MLDPKFANLVSHTKSDIAYIRKCEALTVIQEAVNIHASIFETMSLEAVAAKDYYIEL